MERATHLLLILTAADRSSNSAAVFAASGLTALPEVWFDQLEIDMVSGRDTASPLVELRSEAKGGPSDRAGIAYHDSSIEEKETWFKSMKKSLLRKCVECGREMAAQETTSEMYRRVTEWLQRKRKMSTRWGELKEEKLTCGNFFRKRLRISSSV